MTLDQLEETLEGSEALFLEPRSTFDRAIVGVATQANGQPVLVYDRVRTVQALAEDNGWDEDEAWEFCEFNTFCAYVGAGTPLFLDAVAPDADD
jgi:hypothetical protein